MNRWGLWGAYAGVFNPTQTQYPEDDASRQTVGYTNDGSLFQVTNEPLIAGKDYTLTLEVGHRNDVVTQAPFTIRFMTAGQVLAQTGGYDIPPGQWRDVTLTLTVSDAHPVGSLLEVHLISTGAETHYDNLTLTRKASGNMVSDAILSDKTLHVPGHYPTIQAALDSLNLRSISKDAIVTIQVADGTYADYESIVVDHPDGNKIQILGNTTDPATCTINFKAGVDGVVVSDNRVIGLINGFTLQGRDQTGIGLFSRAGARIQTGAEMIIKDFFNGVYATEASVSCRGIQVYNAYTGIVSYNGSVVNASSALSQGSLHYGFRAGVGGIILAHDALAKNNGAAGFESWLGGTIRAWDSVSQDNLQGYRAGTLSVISAKNSEVSGNGSNYIPTENSIIQQ